MKKVGRIRYYRDRIERCPFKALGGIGLDGYHCDMCSGKPQCVKVCTSEAIYTIYDC